MFVGGVAGGAAANWVGLVTPAELSFPRRSSGRGGSTCQPAVAAEPLARLYLSWRRGPVRMNKRARWYRERMGFLRLNEAQLSFLSSGVQMKAESAAEGELLTLLFLSDLITLLSHLHFQD